jgi:hypothetical protein
MPKRLTSSARTFVVMILAALVAATYLLPGRTDFCTPTGASNP